MKNILTILACLLMGVMSAILASYVPKIFSDFMGIANTGARFGAAGWAVFIYIGLLATILFFTAHAFRILNKKVASIIDTYLKFLD